MKRIILSVSIPLIVFFLFIFWISVIFLGGWTVFFSGNLQCDISFGPASNQHPCGYKEFLSETLYIAYGFFISGWWALVVGAMILIYGGLKFIKNIWKK